MVEAVNQECLQKEVRRSPKKLVYKPGEEAKQAWVATVQNAMEVSNNEDLKNTLQKISQAEEIPLQWIKYSRENFSSFLKHVLVDYQGNSQTDDQLWGLLTKDRPKKKKKKCEKKNGRKYIKNLSKYEKEVGKDTIKKWKIAFKNILQKNISEELKNSVKKIRSACKIVRVKKHQVVNENLFADLLNKIPGYQVNSVIDEQLRILISDELDILHFKEKDEQLLAEGLKAKPDHEDKWLSFLTSLIDRANEKLVNDAEEKIALHTNIIFKWNAINKIDFKRFLSNKLGYEVNSEVANDLWNLAEKTLKEKPVKQKKKRPVSKKRKRRPTSDDGSTAKTSVVEVKKVAITKTAEKTEEKIKRPVSKKRKRRRPTSDADSTAKTSVVEVKKVAVTKTAKKTEGKKKRREKRKKGIDNAGDFEKGQKNVDSKTGEESQKKKIVKAKKVAIPKTVGKKRKRDIDNAGDAERVKKNIDLKTPKDGQKKRTVKGKKAAIKKTKGKKRKKEMETIINGNSPKKIKKTVELKTRQDELCSSLNNAITVSQTEEPCSKVKWISIGKTILRAADNKELPLENFRERIVAEYLNRTGNAASDKSPGSETLWSKCQSKLSKNPKFQIDTKRIRLAV